MFFFSSDSRQLRCKMLLCVQNLFSFIYIEGTVRVTAETHIWKADSFGLRKSKFEINCITASWLCAISTWNCWVMSLSCPSLFIFCLSTFSINRPERLSDYTTEARSCSAEIRNNHQTPLMSQFRGTDKNKHTNVWQETHWHFEFEFVRALCLQSPSCPTFLPFKTF